MDNQKCRFCGKELKYTFANLGLSPISNEYIEEKNIENGQHYFPLHVKVCDKCFLVQSMEYKKPEDIFKDYKYFSSFSQNWLQHCQTYVNEIIERLNLSEKSMVYEIACNDGYLLQYFLLRGIPAYGFEPAENVALEAQKKGIDVEVDFFTEDLASTMVKKRGKADLIIGNNVLAHVPDINGFVKGLSVLLSENGTITMEFPHLLQLIKLNQFDTIYHEHFSYLSLRTVDLVFKKYELMIYDVNELATHGGSLRIYAAHKGVFEKAESVRSILEKEKEYGLYTTDLYLCFEEKIRMIKRNSCRLLIELKEQGKKIVAFGAAAKGNTFLNYCGIGKEYIEYVADSSTIKQGLLLPGSLIPIVSPEKIREDKPDYIVFLAWNLRDEFEGLLQYTREWGCKFITFIPGIEVF